ncbi:MAG: methylated-DNA--[protein]-cysteine S-methyltransferase [Pseudomonadales bacterium]|nr:methylated-DNA--[protein]-cysteine S-methyltransferase [Pseudomonadales bacterium]
MPSPKNSLNDCQIQLIDSPIGIFKTYWRGDLLCRLEFSDLPKFVLTEQHNPLEPCSAGCTTLQQELEQYFLGKLTHFKTRTAPQGTPFQKSVWQQLTQIPYGQTRSYGEVARMVGNPKAARAIGMANNRNPIPVLFPCHRVIGAKGDLVGFGGGLDRKTHLLELEKNARINC